MTDPEFMDRAEAVLQRIEACCDHINDQTDIDIDNQRTGAMITLVFSNQSQIVVNLQKPLHEIWLATRAGGYHYKYDSKEWRDTKDSGEFFHNLSKNVSAQVGQPVSFTA